MNERKSKQAAAVHSRKTSPRHGQTMLEIAKIIAILRRLQYGRSACQKYGRSAYDMALSHRTCRQPAELNVPCTSIRRTVGYWSQRNDTTGTTSRCLCWFKYQVEDASTTVKCSCKGIAGQIGDQLASLRRVRVRT